MDNFDISFPIYYIDSDLLPENVNLDKKIKIEILICELPINDYLYYIDLKGNFNKAILLQIYQLINNINGNFTSGIVSYEYMKTFEKKESKKYDITIIIFIKHYYKSTCKCILLSENSTVEKNKINDLMTKLNSNNYINEWIKYILKYTKEIPYYDVSMVLKNNIFNFIYDEKNNKIAGDKLYEILLKISFIE